MGARTKAIETTAGKWRCSSCGCENALDVDRCETCEVERGTKPPKSRKRDSNRGVGLVNGRTAWQCRGCGRMHPAEANVCSCAIPETQAEAAAKEAAQDIPEIIPTPDAKPSKRRGSAKADPEFIPTAAGRTDWDVPLKQIKRRADNPRQVFDLAKLEQLAESIRSVGLISRIVVRATTGEGWELWAGERRVRACELLGWKEIPARVCPADTPDATMEAIRAWENLQREDLDPIEQARSLQQLLSSGAYASQKALGEAVGLSQGEISLRIRMTELPADWQQKVIAHEISTSHAKHLFAWLDLPEVLEAVAVRWGQCKSSGDSLSERDFKRFIEDAARSKSKTTTKASYGESCPFTITQELREQLDIRAVPSSWGGKPEQRAFNVTLWNQKAKEVKKREKAKAAKTKSPEATQPKPPAGPDESTAIRVLGDWSKQQIKQLLKPKDKKLLQRIMLMGCLVGDGLATELSPVGKRLGIKNAAGLGVYDEDAGEWWQKIASLDDGQLPEVMYEIVVGACGQGYGGLPDELAIAVARALGADPADKWKPEAEDLRDYDEKQLQELAAERGIIPTKKSTKDSLIKALVKALAPGDLPEAFRNVLEGGGDR